MYPRIITRTVEFAELATNGGGAEDGELHLGTR
jgi:hypothetical protein